jgi:hypothetical protein
MYICDNNKKELGNYMTWDNFFYYGNDSLENETNFDLTIGVLQPKRSLFFNRQDSCGISDYENYPNGFSLLYNLKYTIAKWIEYRNGYINTDNPDRRISVSQNTINIKQSGGEDKIDISYIPYADFKNPKKAVI